METKGEIYYSGAQIYADLVPICHGREEIYRAGRGGCRRNGGRVVAGPGVPVESLYSGRFVTAPSVARPCTTGGGVGSVGEGAGRTEERRLHSSVVSEGENPWLPQRFKRRRPFAPEASSPVPPGRRRRRLQHHPLRRQIPFVSERVRPLQQEIPAVESILRDVAVAVDVPHR